MPAGIVLAGGRSTRMGTPKAWLDWHGSTLLHRTCAVVALDMRVLAALNGDQIARDPSEPLAEGDDVALTAEG